MSYLSDLKSTLTPAQYDALVKPMTYQAKQSYKGAPQDWQAQVLMPLDVSKLSFPKQLTVTPAVKPSAKEYTPIYEDIGVGEETNKVVTGYRSKNATTVNGVPVYANYDAKGNLTNYTGDTKKRLYTDKSTSYKGVWDASGMSKPQKFTSSGGGFVKGLVTDLMSDPVMGAVAQVAASYFGGPLGSAALNATTTAARGGNLGDVLESGAKAGLLSYGAQQIAQNFGGGGADQGGDVLGGDMGAGGGEDVYTGGGLSATPGGGFDLASTTGAPSLSAGGINIADMGGAQGLTIPGAAGGALGAAGLTAATGATASGIGSGIGLTDAVTGAGALGSTLGDVGKAALIKGGVSLAGGLLQGETTKDALTSDATARANLANEVKDMGKFTPVGITTSFGTSNFVTDPVTGAITPSYTLSPTAKAWQDSLGGLGTTALSSASDIMNLGKSYIGESPEAVSKNYIDLQKALLAPGREADLAKIRNNMANTGRGGLSFGATSDGMMATNPELAAYYNSLSMADRKIAADADVAARDRVTFGTGLMSNATKPFTSVFDASKSVETAGQQPLTLSTDFANTAATRGAATGANYANAMSPSLSSTYKANTYDPFATFLQGLSDSDLAAWGLSKIKP